MRSRTFATIIVLFTVALAIAPAPQRAASTLPVPATTAQNSSDEPAPAFHSEPPVGALPATLDPSQFTNVVVQNAYAVAAHIKRVLYQQPCYCHCDRSQGHGSLLDCFASKHGAGCEICIREDLFAYEQSRKGKTAKQIRAGIEQGEWQQVDLSKYQAPRSNQ